MVFTPKHSNQCTHPLACSHPQSYCTGKHTPFGKLHVADCISYWDKTDLKLNPFDVKELFKSTFIIDDCRERLSLNSSPFHLQLHQSLLLHYLGLFSVLSISAELMELLYEIWSWGSICNWLSWQHKPKQDFFAILTKHCCFSWLLPFLCCPDLVVEMQVLKKMNLLTTSGQFTPCQFQFVFLDIYNQLQLLHIFGPQPIFTSSIILYLIIALGWNSFKLFSCNCSIGYISTSI